MLLPKCRNRGDVISHASDGRIQLLAFIKEAPLKGKRSARQKRKKRETRVFMVRKRARVFRECSESISLFGVVAFHGRSGALRKLHQRFFLQLFLRASPSKVSFPRRRGACTCVAAAYAITRRVHTNVRRTCCAFRSLARAYSVVLGKLGHFA